MGKSKNRVPKGSVSDICYDDVRLVANYISEVMFLRNPSVRPLFRPDPMALKELLQKMDERAFCEIIRFIKHPNIFAQYPHSLELLLSFENILKYDSYARSAVENIQSVVFMNNSNLGGTEIVQYLMAFFVFVQGGPRLPFTEEGDAPHMPDNNWKIELYNILVAVQDELLKAAPMFSKGLNIDLLRFAIESFSPEKRAVMKKLVGLSLSSKENKMIKRRIYSVPQTLVELAKFKEEILFPQYGDWSVTTLLAFPGLKLGAEINYHSLLKGIEKFQSNNFQATRMQTKTVFTLFGGVRKMPEYRITRQQWEFTDPAEAEMLLKYLAANIAALKGA